MTRVLILLAVLAAALNPLTGAPRDPRRTDTNHSTVGFTVPILGGLSHVTGKFSRFELDFDYDSENPAESRVLAKIDATSVDTGIDERDAHLRAEDFFHTDEFPAIVYESFEVQPLEGDRLMVIGVLTVRDVSHDVELEVRVVREPDGSALGFHGSTRFDRQLFGVRYKHRDLPDFIGDEVTVDFAVLTHPAR